MNMPVATLYIRIQGYERSGVGVCKCYKTHRRLVATHREALRHGIVSGGDLGLFLIGPWQHH